MYTCILYIYICRKRCVYIHIDIDILLQQCTYTTLQSCNFKITLCRCFLHGLRFSVALFPDGPSLETSETFRNRSALEGARPLRSFFGEPIWYPVTLLGFFVAAWTWVLQACRAYGDPEQRLPLGTTITSPWIHQAWHAVCNLSMLLL